MPFEIIRNDLTKMKVDAIVNPTDPFFSGSGGVDLAVHQAAGPELEAECLQLDGILTSQAKITRGYNLPAKHIIHTVGPIWHGGRHREHQKLAACYQNSLTLAKAHNLETIAIPLIASGTFGYPKDKALKIAIRTIGDFLFKEEMMVYLVVYDTESFELSTRLFKSIKRYIDDNFVEDRPWHHHTNVLYQMAAPSIEPEEKVAESRPLILESPQPRKRSLTDVVNHPDETFSEMLLRLIDQKGMTDAEAYKRANLDRKLFSKIRSDKNYQPSKPTVIAFSVALSLSLDETRDLLLKAGFGLSRSQKFDLIVKFHIENGNYNIFEINETLFAYGQPLLGASNIS
jgi:O-acetyl-ADP-ribose deacetylase (regulator of RNase III)